MDGLKLDKWKENFLNEVESLKTEFDSFFKDKDLGSFYSLQLDSSDELTLQLKNDLPNEIKQRLFKLFFAAKPEDSI